MIAVLIDAVLLLVLLKLINNGDRDFMTAIIVAIAVAMGAPILAFAMFMATGDAGAVGDTEIVLAATAAMAIVSGVVMLILGVEFQKSLLTAILYSTIRLVVFLALGMLAVAS